jgi:hypothetical protein
MAEIKIDSKLFQERLSHLVTAWKNDLRSKDGLFGGASSLVIMMGKVEEVPLFHKNNAMHVRADLRAGCHLPARANIVFSSGFWATSFRRHSCSSPSTLSTSSPRQRRVCPTACQAELLLNRPQG